MLLGTLGANLLGNLLTIKGAISMSQGRGAIRNRESNVTLVCFNIPLI